MAWTSHQLSIGVDLHKTQFTVCGLKADGEILHEGIYPCTHEGYDAFSLWVHEAQEKHGLSAVLAVEATGNARYFKNFMENEGFRVKVINTLKFKVVVESVNKTDKRDARVIAAFLAKDFIPESHLCSQYEEDLRRLLKTRSQLVKTIVGLKNNIHGMMLSYGIVTKPSQFQSKKGRQQLRNELEAHTEFNVAAAGVLDCILKVLEDTSASLKEVEQTLERYVEKDDAVAILRTIPGVGLVTSSTIRTWTADIDRFNSYKEYASYCGLVPYLKESNDVTYLGHITKRGPKELRAAMVQVVMGMLRVREKNPDWIFYQRYGYWKSKKSSGKAIIACARKMSRVIYCMLKNKEGFNPEKMKPEKKNSRERLLKVS